LEVDSEANAALLNGNERPMHRTGSWLGAYVFPLTTSVDCA
jgi:hypothetical protein